MALVKNMSLRERVLSKGIKSSLFSSQRIGKVKLFTMWILMSSINAIHKHPFLVQAGLFTPASATLTTDWASSTPSWRTQTPSPACPSTASPPASVWRWPVSPAPTWTLMPGEHHLIPDILLVTLSHVRKNTSSSHIGTVTHLDCPTGSVLDGDNDIECRDDGNTP